MPPRKKTADTSAKLGRPRASRRLTCGPVEDEIIAAARELFRRKGFSATSTREIADAAGLRQPSLFHYYKNKEAIFEAVAIGSVQPVLDFIDQEKQHKRPPDEGLYRLIHFDTYHLCTNENAMGSPFRFPEMTRERLPEFWRRRDKIIAAYKRCVRAGMKQQLFVVDDVDRVTNVLFSMGESTLTWSNAKTKHRVAKKIADTVATMALRAILQRPDSGSAKFTAISIP